MVMDSCPSSPIHRTLGPDSFREELRELIEMAEQSGNGILLDEAYENVPFPFGQWNRIRSRFRQQQRVYRRRLHKGIAGSGHSNWLDDCQ